jgi:hypothetical protein
MAYRMASKREWRSGPRVPGSNAGAGSWRRVGQAREAAEALLELVRRRAGALLVNASA